MIEAIPESQNKKPRSNALLIGLFALGVFIGVETATILIGLNHALAEVGGLRADWEREKAMQNFRLERLEDAVFLENNK